MSGVDVLIVTALKMEFDATRDAALAKRPGDCGVSAWQEIDKKTTSPYLLGDYITTDGSEIGIALARATRMGSTSSAPIIASLVERLHPCCLAMCGVCAGNPSDVALGDVIIAEMTYTYDEGKRNPDSFEGDHRQTPISESWLRAAQDLVPDGLPSFGVASPEDSEFWLLERLYGGQNPRKHPARERYFPKGTWAAKIRELENKELVRRSGREIAITDKGREFVEDSLVRNIDPPDRLPFSIKVGPIASGNVVVKDGVTWDQLKSLGVRSIIGLEMEAAAVGSIARQLSVPQWLVVKGVMDHADPAKDDRYKPFAARASAEVLLKFLGMNLVKPATVQIDPKPSIATGQREWNLLAGDPAVIRRMADTLGQHAPRFEGLLARARSAAQRAYEVADRAEVLANKVRQLLGPAILEARKTFKRREVKILRVSKTQSKELSSNELAGMFWDSGDEYFGEISYDVEFGIGFYKIYAFGRNITPTSIAHYAGEVENGEFGKFGVYTFRNGADFAGEWIDNHPKFGYQEFISEKFDFDYYFGHVAVVPSKGGPRWIPHGDGIAVYIRRAELRCGEFREGILARSATDEALSFAG